MESLEDLNRALEKTLDNNSRDDDATVEIIERLAARPDAEEFFDLPGVFEELADCYSNLGRYDDAIGAMNRALAAGWQGSPDGRCRIAEFLLRAGRVAEADAVYAAVKADTPDDIWLYNSAGFDYAFVGNHGRAIGWLTKGLEIALETGDKEVVVDQLSVQRAKSLEALGRTPDELQERARRFLAKVAEEQAEAAQNWAEKKRGLDRSLRTSTPAFPGVPGPVAVGRFSADEFSEALSRWPHLKESWETEDYGTYCRMLQGTLLKLAAVGLRPRLAVIEIKSFMSWCAEEGVDPSGKEARSGYAARLAHRDQTTAWPPGRNEPCWCGSSRKYKKCCGTVPQPPLDEEPTL